MRPTHALTILLIFVVAALAVFVSGRYAWQADWTYANRNSLTEPSRRLLAAMPGAIAFTAYAYPGPARQRIRDAIDRYRRADDDVSLTFVDPATHPRKMRKLGVKRAGEVRLHYQGRGQTLTGLTEQQISTTLQQLSVAGHQRVVFVTGHGERDPRETGPGGYSTLKAELERQGMQVATLNLAVTPKLPGNATVLVLASPQKAFSASAVELMQKYLAAGGNLLWLGDPSNQARIPKLAALLGFAWQPGTVIYPDFKALGTGNPAMAVVAAYPHHPITRHLAYASVFPYAGGLTGAAGGWQAARILASPARSWLETDALDAGRIAYEKKSGDVLGPITLGIAFRHRMSAAKNSVDDAKQGTTGPQPQVQRAVVVSDSDFLTNANIDTLGNRPLGVAIFQWLAYRDAQIAITIPRAPDASLQLAPWQGRTIWYCFVVLLPATLLLIGIGRWWLRRRR